MAQTHPVCQRKRLHRVYEVRENLQIGSITFGKPTNRNMKQLTQKLIVNAGLLVCGVSTVFSGFLIQINYHIGGHGLVGAENPSFGLSYADWAGLHKISIVLLTALMVYHLQLHWNWYKTVFAKKLFAKNRNMVILSALFLLAAATGFVPWIIDLLNGDEMLRKLIIEIHDKLTVFLSGFLVWHVAKKIKWFIETVKNGSF